MGVDSEPQYAVPMPHKRCRSMRRDGAPVVVLPVVDERQNELEAAPAARLHHEVQRLEAPRVVLPRPLLQRTWRVWSCAESCAHCCRGVLRIHSICKRCRRGCKSIWSTKRCSTLWCYTLVLEQLAVGRCALAAVWKPTLTWNGKSGWFVCAHVRTTFSCALCAVRMSCATIWSPESWSVVE